MRAPASPQLRFLLRGSGLLIGMLILWWVFLVHPLLFGLRMAADAALWLLPGGHAASGVTLASEGDWVLQVPIPQAMAHSDAVQQAYGRAPGAPPVNVRSFKLAVSQRIPTFFTLGFPLFWALVLAAPWSRRSWRVMAAGSGLLAIVAVASLLLYTAYSIESNLKLVSSPGALSIWDAAEYLNVNVLPYMLPVLLAVWLHADLRAQIFAWNPIAEPVPEAAGEAEKSHRGRYRAR